MKKWPNYGHTPRASFSSVRCIERLIKTKQIPKPEGVEQLREICRKILVDYPDSRVAGMAKSTLERWKPYSADAIPLSLQMQKWRESNER